MGIFAKDGQIRVVGKQFVDTVEQRIGKRLGGIDLVKGLYQFFVPGVGLNEHQTGTTASASLKKACRISR